MCRVLNAREWKVWKNQLNVKKFVKSSVGDSDYLEVVVKSILVQEEIDRKCQAEIDFFSQRQGLKNHNCKSWGSSAKLEVLKAPKTIIVKEGQPNIGISMEVKYIGFGEENVGISSTFQGQFISQSTLPLKMNQPRLLSLARLIL